MPTQHVQPQPGLALRASSRWFVVVGHLQRGEPHRRPGRAGHRPHHHLARSPSRCSATSAGTALSHRRRGGVRPGKLVGEHAARVPRHPAGAGGAELAVFCAAIVGRRASRFLWFNTYPASVFSGRRRLAGARRRRSGALAVLYQERGGLSASSTACSSPRSCSVMIQVSRFSCTGQRDLQDGADPPPLRAQGRGEPKIIVRFWIVSILCGAAAGAELAEAMDEPSMDGHALRGRPGEERAGAARGVCCRRRAGDALETSSPTADVARLRRSGRRGELRRGAPRGGL